MTPSKLFWEEDPSSWGKFLRTNLFGVFNCCHTFIPNMVEAKRGRIVTVRSIAKELGRWNVTCNARRLRPGLQGRLIR